MRILITGANGQLGSELQVLSAHYPQFITFFTDVDELDICDEEAVRSFVREKHIECIVNCAAFTAVDRAEEEVELCDLLNHWAPGHLARVASEFHTGLIHISTDYVFNGKSYTPYTETDTVNPVSIYGRTKWEGERLVRLEYSQAVILRTAWLYSSFGKNFVKTMICKGRECSDMGVVFDQVGTPTYARDLAQAVFTIIEKGTVPGVYHYTNEGVTSWYDFAKAVHRVAGIKGCRLHPLRTQEYPTAAVRPCYSVLDKTKFKQTYGVEIPYWEESLEQCIKRLTK